MMVDLILLNNKGAKIMYGGGFIGQSITVVKKTVDLFGDGMVTDTTPDHLVGKTGLVLTANDDRYDAPRPNGGETITLIVKEESGKTFEIPSYFCKPVAPVETDAKAT